MMKTISNTRWLTLILLSSIWLILLVATFWHATSAQVVPTTTPTPSEIFDPEFAIADPLPGGCIGGLPPNADDPVCCLSGVVEVEGTPIEGAQVSIQDARGEIHKVFTVPSLNPSEPPRYFVNLSKLKLQVEGNSRSITPTDVITLVASYGSITTEPIRYIVQPGGQNLNINLFSPSALTFRNETMGQPEVGKFRNIFGADADEWGNLYLWDLVNYRIQVLQPSTNRWLQYPQWQLEIGRQPKQVLGTNDIAIDRKNNRLYFADWQNSRINIYATDGNLIDNIPTLASIWDLAVDNDGNLYAYSLLNGIYKYNVAGQQIDHIQIDSLNYNYAGNVSIATSPQGDLFAIKDGTNILYQFTPTLQSFITIPLQLVNGSAITRPIALAVDESSIYIFDQPSFQIQAFSWDGTLDTSRSWAKPASADTGGAKKLVLVKDDIYVASQAYGVIDRYLKSGGVSEQTWGGISKDAGDVGEPQDLAVAQDGSLLVADRWVGRISKIVDNHIQQSWSLTEVNRASGVLAMALTFDNNQRLVVASNSNDIQRFRIDLEPGRLITDTLPFGSNGTELGKFQSPSGLAADKKGLIYVTDTGNHRVQVLQSESNAIGFSTITSLSTLTATGTFSLPFGIAVDNSNTDTVTPTLLYVSDTVYRHIVKLSFDGTQLHFVGTIGGPDKFASVAHIDLDGDGYLWVTDSTRNQVHRINPKDLSDWRIYGDTQDVAWNANCIANTRTTEGKTIIYLCSQNMGRITSFNSITESNPIATIVNLSAEELEPGDTLTAVADGQDGDATNQIVQYEWAFTPASASTPVLTLNSPVSQVTVPIVAGDSRSNMLGSGLYIMRLRVQDNEGIWSEPVSHTLYVAPQAAEVPQTPIPTPNPTLPPPTPPASCLKGGVWTMLLYLDADNSRDGMALLASYRQSLANLQQLNHPCVQVAVQIDGPRDNDKSISQTVRYLITPTAALTLPLVTGPLEIGEEAMDSAEALHQFVTWGQAALPARHYYLVIADHGNAYQGIAFDHSSPYGEGWNAYLTPSELSQALNAPDVQTIDILHLDACSMALLDVAYELRDKVQYLIASQYIAWSLFAYEDYARYLTQQSDGKALAKVIVDRYANLAEQEGLPYTLSALNLNRIQPVKTGIDHLAQLLKSWLSADSVEGTNHKRFFDVPGSDGQFRDLRNQSQFFDSNANYLNTPRDAYIDLIDFVTRVEQANLTFDINMAAQAILSELGRPDGVILWEHHSKTADLPKRYSCKPADLATCQPKAINMQRAHGISLYYPVEGKDFLLLPNENGVQPNNLSRVAAADLASTTEVTYTEVYAKYINNQLFDFTYDTRWDEFLVAAYGLPPVDVPLATPLPPLPPVDPATLTPTPTITPTPSTTGTPTPTPTTTSTSSPTPTATDTATATPTASATFTSTPTATHTPQPPVDAKKIEVMQSEQQNEQTLTVDTTITNHDTSTLPNVVLVQRFNQPITITLNSAQVVCQQSGDTEIRCSVGDIESSATAPVTFTVQFSSSIPVSSQGQLWVNGQPFGDTIIPIAQDKRVFLPVIVR